MQDAVQAAIEAFKSAQLVALGERHWAREDSEFRLKPICNPVFAETVADIVVEFANPLHQGLLDRYVSGGSVRCFELQKVWQDTTQPGAWDSPVYEKFLSAVREVNTALPESRHIRVLAGDQPIDWSSPQPISKDERDSFAASLIEREVLSQGRKALVLFGSAHIYRNRHGTIVDLLQQNLKAKWFVIVPVGGPDPADVVFGNKGSPSSPEFICLDHSPVGDLYANDVFEKGAKRVKFVKGKPVFVPVQVFEPSLKVREVADACLYFGTALPGFVEPPPELYNDIEYRREIQRRRAVMLRLG